MLFSLLRFCLFAIVSTTLVACGGSDGGSSNNKDNSKDDTKDDNSGKPPKSYSYQEQSDLLVTDTLAGVWVGQLQFASAIEPNPANEQAESESGKIIEFFIIKHVKGNQYLISYTRKDFLNAELGPDNVLTMSHSAHNEVRAFNVLSNKKMSAVVERHPVASVYAESILANGEFIKISNSTDALGWKSWNWSNTTDQQKAGVHYFSKEIFSGKNKDNSIWQAQSIYSSTSTSMLLTSTRLDPISVFCSTLDETASQCNEIGFYTNAGELDFSVDSETSHTFSVSFSSIDDKTALSVTGNIEIQIPLN